MDSIVHSQIVKRIVLQCKTKKLGSNSVPLSFSYSFFLFWPIYFQQVQDDDLLISGFICLSSSSEIIPKCDGSSNIIFATKYPAIDHVWYFLACFPTYLPNFPSQYSGQPSFSKRLSASSMAFLAICGRPVLMQAAVRSHSSTASSERRKM